MTFLCSDCDILASNFRVEHRVPRENFSQIDMPTEVPVDYPFQLPFAVGVKHDLLHQFVHIVIQGALVLKPAHVVSQRVEALISVQPHFDFLGFKAKRMGKTLRIPHF